MFSSKGFIDQFQIITEDDNPLVKLLYGFYLSRFKFTMDSEEYQFIGELQDKIFNCTEEMRYLEINQIRDVFVYLDKVLPCLADIIIMTWCLPRAEQYRSKIIYDNVYQSNIRSYNHILFEIADCYVIRNFCLESLIKKNSIPVHCIDILWYWMCSVDIDIDFNFVNSGNGNFIMIDKDEFLPQGNEINLGVAPVVTATVSMGINMETIFKLGLGKEECSKGAFQKLLNSLLNNETFIKYYSEVDANYVIQRNNLMRS